MLAVEPGVQVLPIGIVVDLGRRASDHPGPQSRIVGNGMLALELGVVREASGEELAHAASGLSRVIADQKHVQQGHCRFQVLKIFLHGGGGGPHAKGREYWTEAAFGLEPPGGFCVGERRALPGGADEPAGKVFGGFGALQVGFRWLEPFDDAIAQIGTLKTCFRLASAEPSRNARRQITQVLVSVCRADDEFLVVAPVADLKVPLGRPVTAVLLDHGVRSNSAELFKREFDPAPRYVLHRHGYIESDVRSRCPLSESEIFTGAARHRGRVRVRTPRRFPRRVEPSVR